jgi:hypothetical protein
MSSFVYFVLNARAATIRKNTSFGCWALTNKFIFLIILLKHVIVQLAR